jgi:hypothetical protein
MRAMDNNTPRMTGSKRWYVAQWPPLAWLETVIKLAGLIIAIVAFIDTLDARSFDFPSGAQLVQWLILVFLSLGLIAAIFDRFIEHEIVAMGFAIINNVGHWSLVTTLLFTPRPTSELLAFASLMLLGDLVKVWFLNTSGFSVRNVSPTVMVGLTLFYVAGYVSIVLLGLAG